VAEVFEAEAEDARLVAEGEREEAEALDDE
jgi:hypothetical protein